MQTVQLIHCLERSLKGLEHGSPGELLIVIGVMFSLALVLLVSDPNPPDPDLVARDVMKDGMLEVLA